MLTAKETKQLCLRAFPSNPQQFSEEIPITLLTFLHACIHTHIPADISTYMHAYKVLERRAWSSGTKGCWAFGFHALSAYNFAIQLSHMQIRIHLFVNVCTDVFGTPRLSSLLRPLDSVFLCPYPGRCQTL